MKAIGFAGAQLYRCRYINIYSVIICAPDSKTAREAFVLWLNTKGHENAIYSSRLSVRMVTPYGDTPILWAQVDVTAS